MKVCFVKTASYHLFAESSARVQGGAEIQFYLLAKELAQDSEFQVSLLTGDYGQPTREKKQEVELYKSVTPRKGDGWWKKIQQARVYWRILREIDADVYLTSAFNNTVSLIAWFCKVNNKKHFHRTAHQREVNGYYQGRGLSGRLFLRALKSADQLITQNREHQELIKENLGRKALILKNSFEILPEKEVDFKKKEYVLWVARFLDWKNPEMFLNLAKNFPREKFVMICSADKKDQTWKDFCQMADKLENLELIPRVPFRQIQDYFDRAKVFVSTSEEEGFPNTFIQAGLGKTPILSYKVNPDNFIKEFDCGYVAESSKKKMKKFLKAFLEDKKARFKKGENAFVYFKKEHDIERNVITFKNFLNEIRTR